MRGVTELSIHVIVGPATISKSDYCLEQIRTELRERPYGRPIIYLVPEQMTFQQEYQLLSDPEIKGSVRAQVLSFSRLAFRVLQECGGATKAFISSTGIQMMLRKIIEQRATDWNIFQKSVEKKGFIEQLEVMITEFKRYRITPDMLAEQITANPGALNDKLADLHYLYLSLTEVLANQYIDGEDRLSLLAEKIPQSAYLKDAIVYVDGFHRFTPQEQAVIGQLMDHTERMTFTLTLDPNELDQDIPFDIFSQTKETFSQLEALALEHDKVVDVERLGATADLAPHLLHLERYFDKRPFPEYQQEVPIQLATAVHPRAEVEGAAQEILRLVRDEGYRYQDIAILMRDSELYQDLIKTIFADYDIPVFVDEKKAMNYHPLVEVIRSGLDVILTNWRYDTVFRMLKTGLIPQADEDHPLNQEAIDTLENYALEYGIRGRNQWLDDQPWVFQRFRGFDQAAQTDQEREMQEKINAYRDQVIAVMGGFDEAFREATTVREKATVLYQWLEKLGVNHVLESWQAELDASGEIEQAREQEQVWQAVIHLLDEMVEMIGDESLSSELFYQTLEAGLDTLTYSHVPPTLDHIVVGSIDHSRIMRSKVAMLFGVNEGTWPAKPQVDTILTEDERDRLKTQGVTLADSETQQLIDDWFYIYLAVTLATDQLWISYPLSDTEGKAKMPSSLIKRLTDLFPKLAEPILLQDPEEMIEAERFVTTPKKTLSALTSQLAKYQRAYPIDSIWWSTLNWFIDRKKQDPMIEMILNSLFYQNKPVHLKPQTAGRVFENKIKASVSRMEMYHRCSYQYFAQHTLKLSDRPTYKLDAPDMGQLFHEALKTITDWVQKEGLTLRDLNQEQANMYAKRALDKLAPILQHQILHSSNRYQYMQKKLEQIIARATFVLSEQARKSDFSPIGMELGFGLDDQSLDPVRMQLANGVELLLRGRIDRVDQAMFGDDLYLRIIDYKSSATGLNIVDVYYGLALQMLAYLDVILTNSERWLGVKASPAGILYFHIHDPMLTKHEVMSQAEIDENLFKEFKMQGLLIDKEPIIQMMDTDLEAGFSPIIPAALKNDGTFRSGSKIASEETFQLLQDHVKQMIAGAGVAITDGEVELNPYQKADRTACQFCPFRSVCQFDPSLPSHQYRKLPSIKEQQIFEKMRETGGSSW